ncbi:MAG: hypothetical protein KY439_01575 [Actinobacteria bacterium]|nr:hypothetical protein [Actinomycetota bacterium]
MTKPEPAPAPSRRRPEQAIDARRHAASAKVASVEKAVKVLGRTGAPVTRAAVSKLAGVSRSFTYENQQARALIAAAQSRAQASADARGEMLTAQQEASWRERTLNAEEEVRRLRQELATQRRMVAELLGQLREPDGTWVAHERERLRRENEQLVVERNNLVRERDDLRRRLDGARAQVSRLNERRVAELFPDGPGPVRR